MSYPNRDNSITHRRLRNLSTRTALILILLVGFGWRSLFMREHHPYTDEFVSMLASQGVQNSGLPILPSGLFYTHGFLYSMLNGSYVGLLRFIGLGFLPESFQFPYRIPSLFFSLLAMAVLYRIGRDWFGPITGLMAAGMLAVAPEAVLWGAMVRMYSLTMLMIPLLAFVTYKTMSAPPQHRTTWQITLALTLAAAFMSHFITVLFLPPLLLGVALLTWRMIVLKGRPWFLTMKSILIWGLIIAAAAGGSALLQSRSVPPNSANFTGAGAAVDDVSLATITNLIGSQINLAPDWTSVNKFVTRIIWGYSFDSRFNATLFLTLGLGSLTLLLLGAIPRLRRLMLSEQSWKLLFLFVVALGPLIELIFFVAPYRQTPRYFLPFWPLVFLLFGAMIGVILTALARWIGATRLSSGQTWGLSLGVLAIIALFARAAGPEIAGYMYSTTSYDQGFRFIKQHWQPGDIILTPYSAASGMYLGQVDYFAADVGAEVALLNSGQQANVDRYWGAPLLSRGRDLQSLLRTHPRVWFVVMDWLYSGYFQADWHFVQQQNMKLVWSSQSTKVYLNDAQGITLPEAPAQILNTSLGDSVQLQGYTSSVIGSVYRLFLFWKVMSPVRDDLTQFVHVRNQRGETIAQADVLPLNGQYPTSSWQIGETVIDVIDIPIPPDLPPDEYRIFAGLYRWDTLERLIVIDDASGENAVEIETLKIP